MKSYRVWVEKNLAGWVEVEATDRDTARDLAKQAASDRDWWASYRDVRPSTVEDAEETV